MDTIRFIDLLANTGELRTKFEKAFATIDTKIKCVLTSRLDSDAVYVIPRAENRKEVRIKLSDIQSKDIPTFDFLLAGFPFKYSQGGKDSATFFSELERIIKDKKPYGFIIENFDSLLMDESVDGIPNTNVKLYQLIDIFNKLGYKMSWKLVDGQKQSEQDSKKVFIIGTLGTETVFSNIEEKYKDVAQKHSEFIQWLLIQNNDENNSKEHTGLAIDSTSEMTKVQKELLHILVEENRRNELEKSNVFKESPIAVYPEGIEKKDSPEKEVYFKLYPPKKLVEITEEDGSVTGLVHSFIFQEVFEETVKELDFTRNLMSDLELLFTSSGEQLLIINEEGVIVRVSGTFLSRFWQVDNPNKLVGEKLQTFVNQGIFQPNVYSLCKKKSDKVTAIQESENCRIWSVATPVYEGKKLKKVIVLSKEIAKNQDTLMMDKDHHTNSPVALPISKDKRLIYRSNKIKQIITQLIRAAKMNSTILIEGETGVGKEIFAQKVHKHSERNNQAFIRINCGAIPEKLIESELFGYEKGSFTGADRNGKIGYFELADKGTIFLDEIGELPINLQVKLLRVLQEREITRIGGTEPISVDVRIIAATNRNLKELVQKGEFREDLYYRLNVIPFRIPPLRERTEDIFPMAIYFLEKQKRLYNMNKSFTPEAIEVLETYDWPGNVRELQNIIERLLIYSDEEWIQREHVLPMLYGSEEISKNDLVVFQLMPLKKAIKEVERQLIELGMKKYDTAAKLSKVLDISPATLSRRMKEVKNES